MNSCCSLCVAVSLCLMAWLLGCGSGTAVVASLIGSDASGGSNTPTVARDLRLDDPDRQSPGTIRFNLVDAESTPADVQLRAVKGKKVVEIARLEQLATSPAGEELSFQWDYKTSFPSFTDNVSLEIVILTNPRNGEQGGTDGQEIVNVNDDPPGVDHIEVRNQGENG